MVLSFGSLIIESPIFIICFAGIIAALIFWQYSPRSATLTLIGMILFLITSVARTVLPIYLSQLKIKSYLSIEQLREMLFISGVITVTIQAIALGLVLIAVFIGRKTTVKPLWIISSFMPLHLSFVSFFNPQGAFQWNSFPPFLLLPHFSSPGVHL